MSQYTTQIRAIVESFSSDTPNLSVDERITIAAPKIFNFSYPIWTESYRVVLESKILRNYYMREIGFDTVALWSLNLNNKLNVIMPYYNELYQTTSEKFDFLNDVEYTESYNDNKNINKNDNVNVSSTITNKTEGTNNVTIENENLSSDLPQVNYAGVDYGTNLDRNSGTNNQTVNNSSSTTNTNDTKTTADDKENSSGERIKRGLTGSHTRSQLVMEYRQSLLNIDSMIIEELADLFITIY